MQSATNQIKIKVTDICTVVNQKQWNTAIFKLCDITQTKLNMHQQNKLFPAIHFNFVFL